MRRVAHSSWIWFRVTVAFGLLLFLAGCDPSFVFSDAQVWVRVNDDGSAILAADVSRRAMSPSVEPPDPGVLSAQLVTELGLGQPDSAPQVFHDEFPFNPVGIGFAPARSTDGREGLTVNVGALAASLRASGVKDDAQIFVSVCNAAGHGGATGTWVRITWKDSCGVVDRPLGEIAPDAEVRLRDVDYPVIYRLAPSGSTLFVALLAAVAGLGLGLLSPRQQHGRKAAAALILAVAATSLFAAFEFTGRSFSSDSMTSVGQRIGSPTPPSTYALLSLFIGAVAVVGGLIQQVRTVDARTASSR